MINLSKAYAGQIAHLNDGNEFTIKSIKKILEPECYAVRLESNKDWYYSEDGVYLRGANHEYSIDLNISSLEDDYFVQVARIEGEIEAYENILLIKPAAATFDFILQKRADAKAQLLTLQNNQ